MNPTHTALVSGGTSVALVILQYLVHPIWPPPESILALAVGFSAPFAHLIGRGIYARLANWSAGQPIKAPVSTQP